MKHDIRNPILEESKEGGYTSKAAESRLFYSSMNSQSYYNSQGS